MNYAIMLSGGIGSRVGGDIPKQYLKIKDKRIIYYSLESLIESEMIDKIVIVAAEEWISTIELEVSNKFKDKLLGFAKPGETRQLSVVSGMDYIKEKVDVILENDTVFIHDAARPYLTIDMIEKYTLAIDDHDGVLPVLPMKDTVYLSGDGKSISSLINKKTVFAGQAPEIFKFNKYYEANIRLIPNEIIKINGSTEPAIMAGMDVVMVPGEEKNIKITTKEDLEKLLLV